jgi:hypothetical protein
LALSACDVQRRAEGLATRRGSGVTRRSRSFACVLHRTAIAPRAPRAPRLSARVTMGCHVRWGRTFRLLSECCALIDFHPRLAQSHVLPPSFADGERLILCSSVAPCVRFRPLETHGEAEASPVCSITLSHRLRRWLRPPSLAAPLPTHKHFFPFRALRPCVCVHPRLARWNVLRRGRNGLWSGRTFYSPSERYALASTSVYASWRGGAHRRRQARKASTP